MCDSAPGGSNLNGSLDVETLKIAPHNLRYPIDVYAPDASPHPETEVSDGKGVAGQPGGLEQSVRFEAAQSSRYWWHVMNAICTCELPL